MMLKDENVKTTATSADEETTSNQRTNKEYDGFLFLPSFRESYDCLVKAGELDRANMLLRAIVSYGTEGTIVTDDPYIEIVMVSIRKTIDSQRKKYKAKVDETKKKEEEAFLAEMEKLRKETLRKSAKYKSFDL